MNERENKDPRINLGEIATFREGKVRNKRLVGKEIRRGCRQRGGHSEEKKTGKVAQQCRELRADLWACLGRGRQWSLKGQLGTALMLKSENGRLKQSGGEEMRAGHVA